jgi:5-methyltetrahydropteroyltriglutamate--homocysteine methyltransferase
VDEAWLVEAQDDATRLAVRDMEEAGIDVVTDGEIRRESYSNYFANALEGLDLDEPGTALDRTGHPNPVPRVLGEIRRARPVQVRDAEFLRALTSRPIRVTVPGPFTMSQQAQNDHYPDLRSLALAYADVVNEELRDLVAAGADVVQIDEPYLQARPDDAQVYALEAIARAFEGVGGTKALHTCFGYAAIVHEKPNGYPFLAELDACPADEISIEAAQPRLDPSLLELLPTKRVILGVLDLNDMEVETTETVADRINDMALTYGVPEAPFGGVKESGVGQVNGALGLRGYCHLHPMLVDRFGGKKIQGGYPYTAKDLAGMKRFAKFLWGTPLGRWLS